MPTKCFLLTETDRMYVHLRRFCFDNDKCPVHGYHNARTLVGDAPKVKNVDHNAVDIPTPPRDDSRWPTFCDCGYKFLSTDEWQLFIRQQYIDKETGKLTSWERAEIGAMRYIDWIQDMVGPDGRTLEVKTPGGDWIIDSMATNCTMKNDRIHRCWVRHGIPPMITVDKNGNTCAAGAGSIQIRDYHGFLTNGFLT